MTREEIKLRYIDLYKRMNRVGRSVKYGALAYMVLQALSRTVFIGRGRSLLNASLAEQIIAIFFFIGIASLVIIPIPIYEFFNFSASNEIKNNYKKDLLSVMKYESPEIADHISNQKIHPLAFKKSKLFPVKYTDYIGDDWHQGFYKGVEFEFCELRVYDSFNVVFNGIFFRCFFTTHKEDSINNISQYSSLFQELHYCFEKRYEANVKISNIEDCLYLAFQRKGHFFEIPSRKKIELIEQELNILKEMIQITKVAIDQRG